MIYNELMSDFEMDEKDFAADSWSLAVDSSFLQQHKKEVMKQQDVIYGEPARRPPRDRCSFPKSCCLSPLCLPPASGTPLSWPLGHQHPARHPTSRLRHRLLGPLVSKALSFYPSFKSVLSLPSVPVSCPAPC